MLLLRWCGFISVHDMQVPFSEETLLALSRFRFVTVYKKHDAYVLTLEGSRFLDAHFEGLPPYVKPTYREAYIIRRLRISRLLLAAYRAGLSVFQTETVSLEQHGAFYLTSKSRVKGMNPWGSTRIAALLRLGEMICGAYYVESGIGVISLTDEMNAMNNSTAQFKDAATGLIFTGESYEAVLSALSETEERANFRRITYGDVFRKLQMPVFLIPSNEVGARQLCMMIKPDYRERMTRLALGSAGLPPPPDHPEWDALYQGVPFVMAADMDFHRINAAAESAIASGQGPIYLVAIKGQEEVLRKRYKAEGLVQKVFIFSREKPEVKAALTLYTPSDRQFETAKGGVIHVPPIPLAHKSKGPA